MIFTTTDFEYTTKEFEKRGIPFQPVRLNRCGKKEQAIYLSESAWIMVKAGMVLSDN